MGLQRNSKVVSSFLWYHVVPFRNETWQWKILRVLAVHPPSSHPLPTSAATRSMAFSTASLVSGLAFLQGSPQVNKVGSSNPVSIVIFAINPSYTQVLSRRLHVWNIYYSYICPKNGPNVGKYDIHGASGWVMNHLLFVVGTSDCQYPTVNWHMENPMENPQLWPN